MWCSSEFAHNRSVPELERDYKPMLNHRRCQCGLEKDLGTPYKRDSSCCTHVVIHEACKSLSYIGCGGHSHSHFS